jgi:hypothetical protein
MATPPTLEAEYETAWSAVGAGAKTASVTVAAGDVLAIFGMTESNTYTLATPTGGGLTYTLEQSIVAADYCTCYVWTATSGSSQTFTLSITMSGGTGFWGWNALRWSGSDGIGASTKTNVSSGAPSLALTTGTDNSAIVAANGDWNAVDGASRTWRTINSITPATNLAGGEATYARDGARATVYGAYWSNAGTAGSKTTGLSAPGAQKYSIIAVEVKGTSASATNAAAETATAAGAAQTPTTAGAPVVEAATASAAAQDATVTTAVIVTAECATAAAAAQDPTIRVAPVVEAAGGTAVANDATVETGADTNATAEAATATGAAHDPSAAVAPVVEAAEASGVAQDAIGGSVVVAQAETASGSASYDTTTALAPPAEAATAAAAGEDLTAAVAPVVECATATSENADATVTAGSGTNAQAECATGSAAADHGLIALFAQVEAALAEALAYQTVAAETPGLSYPAVMDRRTSAPAVGSAAASAPAVTGG